MLEFWNDRYRNKDFAYGTEPNEFFKESLDKLDQKGSLMLAAEGEGRNAVYAASKGFTVSAFDISIEGKNKADQLAEAKGVKIDYKAGPIEQHNYEKESYDVLGLIFAHFPPPVKAGIIAQVSELVKPNGVVILEAFSKAHLELAKKNPKVGGPKNLDILYSVEEIEKFFPNYEPLYLKEELVNLEEGLYHQGESSVIRFIGRKKG